MSKHQYEEFFIEKKHEIDYKIREAFKAIHVRAKGKPQPSVNSYLVEYISTHDIPLWTIIRDGTEIYYCQHCDIFGLEFPDNRAKHDHPNMLN